MLYSQFYKIMVNEVTFVGFRGGVAPLDPPCLLLPNVICSEGQAKYCVEVLCIFIMRPSTREAFAGSASPNFLCQEKIF